MGGNLNAFSPPSISDLSFSTIKSGNNPYYSYWGNYTSPLLIPVIDTTKFYITNDIYGASNTSDTVPSNYPPLHIVNITSNDVEVLTHTREFKKNLISDRIRTKAKVSMILTTIAITMAVAVATAFTGGGATPLAIAAGAVVGVGLSTAGAFATKAANNAIQTSYGVAGEDLGDGDITSVYNDASNPGQYSSVGNENPNGPCSDDVVIGKISSKYFFTYNNNEEHRLYPFGDVIDVVNNVMNAPKINMFGTREGHWPELYMLNFATRYYTIRNKYLTKQAYMMPLIKKTLLFLEKVVKKSLNLKKTRHITPENLLPINPS
jgi:hypothetical protein